MMNCDRCGKPFVEGDRVDMVTPYEVVTGRGLVQVEDTEYIHEQCPAEEEAPR